MVQRFAFTLVALLAIPFVAFANHDNGNGNSNDGGPSNSDCSTLVSQGDDHAVAICGSLSVNVQKQVCSPVAVCEQYTNQVCGDATAVCGSDDTLLAIGLGIGKARAACEQSTFTAVSTKQYCGDSVQVCSSAEQSCGDTALTCGDLTSNVSCPDISVVVEDGDIDCRKCVNKVKRFKDGSIRSEKKVCFGCNVDGEFRVE